MKKSILLMILMIAFAANSFGQATATASATIVTPIAISTVTSLNFGNVAAGAAAGTVVLAPAGGRVPTNVILPATAGTVSAASFYVTGTFGYTFDITIPIATFTTTIANGLGQTMIVSSYTSSVASGTIDNSTTPTFTVGATLNVAASQAGGTYSSQTAGGTGPFTVTVNYN